MRLSALALSAAFASAAFGCGACDEDKVAATYDHAVVRQALAAHRVVVYAAIDGPVDVREATARIARQADHTRGIRQSTLRLSTAPAAFSFVVSASKERPDAVVADLQRRVNVPGLQLHVVRIVQ